MAYRDSYMNFRGSILLTALYNLRLIEKPALSIFLYFLLYSSYSKTSRSQKLDTILPTEVRR